MFKRFFCFVCLMTSVASVNAMEPHIMRELEAPKEKSKFFEKQQVKVARFAWHINGVKNHFKRKKMEDSRKKELFYKQKNGKLERNKKHLQKKLQNRKDLSKLSKYVANKIKAEKVGENKIDLSSMVPMGPQNLSNGSKEQILIQPKITGSSVVYNEKKNCTTAWMITELEDGNFHQIVMVIKDLVEGKISGSKTYYYSDGTKKESHLSSESPYVKKLLKGISILEKKKVKFLFHGDF